LTNKNEAYSHIIMLVLHNNRWNVYGQILYLIFNKKNCV